MQYLKEKVRQDSERLVKEQEEKNKTKIDDSKTDYTSLGISLGMCFGTSFGCLLGVILKNISLWMCIGISMGMCIGLAIGSSLDKKK